MSEPLCDPMRWKDAPLEFDLAAIQERLPQREDMALLHGVVHLDQDEHFAIGIHQSSQRDFWVKGHMPGRPIMPGVVMVETAAQLCAFTTSFSISMTDDTFFGFGGLDKARFRGQVTPGARLVIAARVARLRRTMAVYRTQAFVDGQMVYEGEILGLSI